jgi:glycolate oxidase
MNLWLDIEKIVGKPNLLTDAVDKVYAHIDQSTNVRESEPFCVVRVHSISELIDVVQLCIKNKRPIVMRGAGTGKSGGAVADHRSVVIDAMGLNRIISIDKENLFAEVEPGVVLDDFQKEVIKHGLFYPPDPASARFCTLGGNVAENAAGPSTLKYGTTKDYLLGGQAIIGTGEVIDFGKQCPKGVTGFDIAGILCGSEGTLAVFTKLRLRLLPLPKSVSAGFFFFADEAKALRAVNAILNQGHWPTTLEYVDHSCLMALNALTPIAMPPTAKAALIIECDASYENGAEEQMNAISGALASHSLIAANVAYSAEEREQLWHLRSLLSEACTKWLSLKISEDIAVPLGKIGTLAAAIKQWSMPPHLVCALFGHAGDGNLHVQIMFDHDRWQIKAQEIRHQLLLLVLSLGGTLSAEHGIGLQKKAYLPLEQSPSLIDLQKRIKQAFDPLNLLNPGKIFDV